MACLLWNQNGGGSVGSAVALMLLALVSSGGGGAQAEQVHHVVGGDRGWEVASNVAEWSVDKAFRVGDNIWFTYAAAQETIAELRSREEFESCDTSNPIRMYTDGIDKVTLDGEGTRYFVSSKSESCKNGLKLHIDVESTTSTSKKALDNIQALATGPSPSSSVRLGVTSLIWTGLALLWFMSI